MTFRVAITGASGFVGRHVSADLAHHGIDVVGLVREASQTLPEGVESRSYRGIHDREGLQRGFQGADSVVHLAARVHRPRRGGTDARAAFRNVNVEGTRAVLEAAKECCVRQVVFVSSVSALGTRNRPCIDDDMTPAPESPYGFSKRAAERLVQEYALSRVFRGVVLRPPAVYGPGMKGALKRLAKHLERGYPLPLPRIPPRRSFLYIENLTAAVRAVFTKAEELPAYGCYLIADRTAPRLDHFVHAFAEAMGRTPRIAKLPRSLMAFGAVSAHLLRAKDFSTSLQRLMEPMVITGTALERAIGHRPPVSWRTGVARTAGAAPEEGTEL